jgi:hypothetical protein
VKGAALDACGDSVIGEKVLRRRQFTERVRVERGRIVGWKDSGITERRIVAATTRQENLASREVIGHELLCRTIPGG